MNVFVDFEGFRFKNGEYFVKELALLSPCGNVSAHYIFKPPFELNSITDCKDRDLIEQKEKRMGIHNAWSTGFTDYNELEQILNKFKDMILFVRSPFKKHFLEKIFQDKRTKIYDLREYNCPAITVLQQVFFIKKDCPFNHRNFCALINAMIMMSWWADFSKHFPTIDKINENIIACNKFGLPPKEVFFYLPKQFIIERYGSNMNAVWDRLPPHFKFDEDIQKEMFCKEHDNSSDDWVWGGIKKKDCIFCSKNY